MTQGACIRVVFSNGNSVAYPTLNVNGAGAKEIRCARGRLDTQVTSDSAGSPKKGQGVYSWDTQTGPLDLFFDGAYWRVIGDPVVQRFYDNDYLRMNVTITGIVRSGFLY